MSTPPKFELRPYQEPLCTYDGSQESLDNCVAVMCENLAIQKKEDGQYPGEMILVTLWARILQLEAAGEKT